MFKLVIKDMDGNVIPGAQIHVVKDNYYRDKDGILLPDLTNYYKHNLFYYDDKVPACNPLICDASGSTHTLVEIGRTDKGPK